MGIRNIGDLQRLTAAWKTKMKRMIETKIYFSAFDQSFISLLNNRIAIRTMKVSSVKISIIWSEINLGHLKITTYAKYKTWIEMKITAFVVLSSPFRKKTNTQRRNLFKKKRKVWI